MNDELRAQMEKANALGNQLLMELGQMSVDVRNGFVEDQGLHRRVATAAVRTAFVGALAAFLVSTFGEEKRMDSSEGEKMHIDLLNKIDETIKEFFLSKGASIIASEEFKSGNGS